MMLAYAHHYPGVFDWLLGIVVRGSTYRLLGAVPLPAVVLVGVVALVLVVVRRRRSAR